MQKDAAVDMMYARSFSVLKKGEVTVYKATKELRNNTHCCGCENLKIASMVLFRARVRKPRLLMKSCRRSKERRVRTKVANPRTWVISRGIKHN